MMDLRLSFFFFSVPRKFQVKTASRETKLLVEMELFAERFTKNTQLNLTKSLVECTSIREYNFYFPYKVCGKLDSSEFGVVYFVSI